MRSYVLYLAGIFTCRNSVAEADVGQQVKPRPHLSPRAWLTAWLLSASDSNAPGKAAGDGPSAWAPNTHEETQIESPAPGFDPAEPLAAAGN